MPRKSPAARARVETPAVQVILTPRVHTPGDRDPVVVDAQARNRPFQDDDHAERETRGAKKRRAEQLERLGESLVLLAEPKLARVPMPDDLRDALTEARRLKATSARGGYRRQVQFLGRIMRSIDALPIAAALDAMRHEDAPSAASFQAAEHHRDALVAASDGADVDALLDALLRAHPQLDRTHLRQLVRQAHKEAHDNKPPHAARALFRALREAFVVPVSVDA